MQRQSLGSPGRGGLVSKDDAVSVSDDPKRRESSPSLYSGDDDDEIKPEKPLRRCHAQPEKFIHLIPILIILCFFILYLSSHDPTPKDLAQFDWFNHPEKIIDSGDIDDIGRTGGNNNKKLKRSGAFAIRSLRNLQEEIQYEEDDDSTQKPRSHRKLGDF